MTTQSSEERSVLEAVGETIHMHMWRQKISQTEAGRAIGVGQSTFSKKLRGEVRLDVAELMTIARLLGVEPGDLLPRLDSNQQPSGYGKAQVSGLLVSARQASRYCYECSWWHRPGAPCGGRLASVVDLASWRERVAS